MRSRLQCALQGIMIFATPTYRGNVIKLSIIVSTAFPLRGRWQPKADG